MLPQCTYKQRYVPPSFKGSSSPHRGVANPQAESSALIQRWDDLLLQPLLPHRALSAADFSFGFDQAWSWLELVPASLAPLPCWRMRAWAQKSQVVPGCDLTLFSDNLREANKSANACVAVCSAVGMLLEDGLE